MTVPGFAGDCQLLQWLDNPDGERGIRFGREGDGWDYYSYEMMAVLARQCAWRLREAGVSRGDVVAIIYPNSPGFVAAFLGCLMLGGTPAPVAPPARFSSRPGYQEYLSRLLRTGSVRAVATRPEFAPLAAPAAEAIGARLIVAPDAPDAPGALDGRAPQYGASPLPPEIGLLQFSSGATGPQRGVRVPLAALEANIDVITWWVNGQRTQDAVASWLPLHHDMGLIGCLLAPLSRNADVWLLNPEQFVRSPMRWLRCFGQDRATFTAVPTFGLSHLVRLVRPEMLAGLDFSGWRALVVGAERVDAAAVGAFTRLLEPHGFSRTAVMPAYGLAEATLAVSGSRRGEEVTSLVIDPASLSPGKRVQVETGAVAGADAAADPARHVVLVGCGRPLPGVSVAIVDENGRELDEGYLGEIQVSGHSVAFGYVGEAGDGQRLDGVVRSGDAGFVLGGEVFVVGRIGDSVKVRGQWLFAEDIDTVVRSAVPASFRHVALLGTLGGGDAIVVVVEGDISGRAADLGSLVANHASGLRVVLFEARRGSILRTTSGKPRRRLMWECFVTGRLDGMVRWDSAKRDVPGEDGEDRDPAVTVSSGRP